MMLADQIDSKNDFRKLSPDDFEAEWKWDGIRVQLIISDTETVIFQGMETILQIHFLNYALKQI